MKAENICLLGPGKSSLDYKLNERESTLAFQEVFPNCIQHLGIIPDYWVSADPYAYISGMMYLLANLQNKKLRKINILIPNFFTKDSAHYKRYCGSTPLIRESKGWDKFTDILQEVGKHYNVKTIPTTTTKYIKIFSQNKDLKNINEQGHEYVRFMHDEVIFGTVDFDSESVIGDKFKWGLENKLTSAALPICYYLGAKKVKVYGFDYQGPRFYSDIARHPWNDETQGENTVEDFSLSLLKKWVQWEGIHGMKIISGTKDPISLPSKFLQYEE